MPKQPTEESVVHLVPPAVIAELKQRLFQLMDEHNKAQHRSKRAAKSAETRLKEFHASEDRLNQLSNFILEHSENRDLVQQELNEAMQRKMTDSDPEDEEEVPVAPRIRR